MGNQLVGNYRGLEHHACATQLLHNCLNHVFELAGVKYQPRPEPIARVPKKRKATGVSITPPRKRVARKSGGRLCPVQET
jgi:hypothetical protein